ncbi:MAG: hypothetical protein WCO61_02755 [Alphaproteobacteria bacterium]
MSKKPEKAAPKAEAKSEAPADAHAAEHAAEGTSEASSETAEASKEKAKGGKDAGKPKAPSIEEAIQLALATAETTADASSDVAKIKKQVAELVTGASRSNKLLISTGVLFLFMASIALGISVAFYYKAMNRFDSMTNVNRDALMAFAEEVNAFTTAATRVEKAATESEKRLAALMAQQEEIKALMQGDIANQQAIQGKIAENSEAMNNLPAATRKMIEDLVASNKLVVAQVSDAMKEQIKAMEASNPKVDLAKQIEEIVKKQQAEAMRTAAMEAQKAARNRKAAPQPDIVIKYP